MYESWIELSMLHPNVYKISQENVNTVCTFIHCMYKMYNEHKRYFILHFLSFLTKKFWSTKYLDRSVMTKKNLVFFVSSINLNNSFLVSSVWQILTIVYYSFSSKKLKRRSLRNSEIWTTIQTLRLLHFDLAKSLKVGRILTNFVI